jgi:hypothetical protein
MPKALTPFAFQPPPAAVFGDEARMLLKAARMWVILARQHRNPRPIIENLLGGGQAAFCTLMDQLVTVWPDPFTTYPPCACALSPDEHSLIRLLSLAGAGDEAGADRLLEDLLPGAERTRLWQAASRAVAEGPWHSC